MIFLVELFNNKENKVNKNKTINRTTGGKIARRKWGWRKLWMRNDHKVEQESNIGIPYYGKFNYFYFLIKLY